MIGAVVLATAVATKAIAHFDRVESKQLVPMAHRDPMRGHAYALPNATASQRVDKPREADPDHGRLPNAHGPRLWR